MGLGRGEPQDAVQVLGFEPGGYHGVLRFAVLLDLLLHVDAGHAVALLQLIGHERISFALVFRQVGVSCLVMYFFRV